MEKLFTIKETAEYFKITPRTVERLVRSGELGSVRVGRQRRIRQSDIERYLNAGAVEGKQEEVES